MMSPCTLLPGMSGAQSCKRVLKASHQIINIQAGIQLYAGLRVMLHQRDQEAEENWTLLEILVLKANSVFFFIGFIPFCVFLTFFNDSSYLMFQQFQVYSVVVKYLYNLLSEQILYFLMTCSFLGKKKKNTHKSLTPFRNVKL